MEKKRDGTNTKIHYVKDCTIWLQKNLNVILKFCNTVLIFGSVNRIFPKIFFTHACFKTILKADEKQIIFKPLKLKLLLISIEIEHFDIAEAFVCFPIKLIISKINIDKAFDLSRAVLGLK